MYFVMITLLLNTTVHFASFIQSDMQSSMQPGVFCVIVSLIAIWQYFNVVLPLISELIDF